MFNFSAAELVVLGLLALIFFGPKRLPPLVTVARERRAAPDARRWSWSDWLLVCAALLSFGVVLALLGGP